MNVFCYICLLFGLNLINNWVMSIKLSKLQIGESGKIEQILDKGLMNRLYEMGIRPGQCIKLLNHAPFMGPITIQSGQMTLAIRATYLKYILVSKQ